jgi:hypothetical protein
MAARSRDPSDRRVEEIERQWLEIRSRQPVARSA